MSAFKDLTQVPRYLAQSTAIELDKVYFVKWSKILQQTNIVPYTVDHKFMLGN